MSGSKIIEEIEGRICELQKSHVSLQEKLKLSHNDFERRINTLALKIIDILDLIETVRLNMNFESQPNTQLFIKKIEKRLVNVLKHNQVQEITLKDGELEAGKTRVIEKRKAIVGASSHKGIVEVCRKGYQRGNVILRPVDVITEE